MSTFEQFRQELREALVHLHDAAFEPTQLLCSIMGFEVGIDPGRVQSAITRLIRNLEPTHEVPMSAQARRDFDILYHRFILKLTQEETAERLSLSDRTVRRAQREATHALARLLWEHGHTYIASAMDAAADREPQSDLSPDIQAADWHAQLKQDIVSLQASAPETMADVGQAIGYSVQLESVLTLRRGMRITIEHLQPNLTAAIHPFVLRQLLVMVIGHLIRLSSQTQIRVRADLMDELAVITLAGATDGPEVPLGMPLVQDILAMQGGSMTATRDGEHVQYRLTLPSVSAVRVLIVDDNVDLVHFYRRCTIGTRYHVMHAAPGQRNVEAIRAVAPDIIVLDILLPDTDGWQLLESLQANPATQAIPVIICSIIREEDLAKALGAAAYLPKPVRRREFIQSLGQALHRASTEAQRN